MSLVIFDTSDDCFFTQLADGVILEKVSCPLGVLLVVFESRPDALVQVNVMDINLFTYVNYIIFTFIIVFFPPLRKCLFLELPLDEFACALC